MSNGIWISPNEFVEFSDVPQRELLLEEIATRQAAWDWTGFLGLLPDPDPVLRKLADGGAEVLERLTSDGHLISVLQSRKLGTLKKEFRWEAGLAPGEDDATTPATKLAEDLAADLENVDLYNLLSGILDAPYYGNTPIEIKWQPGSNRLAIKDLEVKPTRWFGFNDKNEPRFVSMHNPWDGVELPFGKFVLARHFPTYDNPFGLRLGSRCFWPCAFKKGGIKFLSVLCEKYGIPFLIGKHRPGATPTEKQDMLSSLSKMVRDAVAVIAQGGAVEILETGKSGTGDSIHLGLVHEMNAEMSKVIMGQTLTAEVSDKGGSRAQGQVHEEILEDFRQGDQTLVKKTMEEIAWLYGKVNAPGVPSPKFIWYEEEEPKKEMAERDKILKETGVKFRKNYYMRQYSLQEDDFDIVEPGTGDQGPGTGKDKKAGTRDQESGTGKKVEKDFTGHGSLVTDHGLFPDQAAIDTALDALSKEALQGQAEQVLKPILESWQETQDPEQLRETLLNAFPHMHADALEEMLARVIFIGDVWGRLNA